MASHLPIYRNYAHQWRVFKDIRDCNLHQLGVSSCQECGLQSVSAASLFMDQLYCYNLPSALHDDRLSLNTFKRHLKSHLFKQSWTSPGAVLTSCDWFSLCKCRKLTHTSLFTEIGSTQYIWNKKDKKLNDK